MRILTESEAELIAGGQQGSSFGFTVTGIRQRYTQEMLEYMREQQEEEAEEKAAFATASVGGGGGEVSLTVTSTGDVYAGAGGGVVGVGVGVAVGVTTVGQQASLTGASTNVNVFAGASFDNQGSLTAVSLGNNLGVSGGNSWHVGDIGFFDDIVQTVTEGVWDRLTLGYNGD